jgi:hypothetical protein
LRLVSGAYEVLAALWASRSFDVRRAAGEPCSIARQTLPVDSATRNLTGKLSWPDLAPQMTSVIRNEQCTSIGLNVSTCALWRSSNIIVRTGRYTATKIVRSQYSRESCRWPCAASQRSGAPTPAVACRTAQIWAQVHTTSTVVRSPAHLRAELLSQSAEVAPTPDADHMPRP